MIRKAVIPAAGLGTRFRPVTRSVPKEMLPVVDTPVLQLVVEEAVASGIEEILIITAEGKDAIEAHFDANDAVRFARQKERRGLGDALRYAREFTADDPFAVLNGDTIFDADVPATRQLADAWKRHKKAVVGVERVPREKVSRYGIVEGREIGEGMLEVVGLVEKPLPDAAPSDLAIAGRYILTPEVHALLDGLAPGAKGEIQLTDALGKLAAGEGVVARIVDGKRFDLGDRLEYVVAQVVFGLKRDELAGPLGDALRRLVESDEGR